MDRLKVKLQTMYEACGGRKVDVITHSMGGLVVKSFLALHREVKDIWLTVTMSIGPTGIQKGLEFW